MIPKVIPTTSASPLDLFRMERLRAALAKVELTAIADRETRQALLEEISDLDDGIVLAKRAWRLTEERLAAQRAAEDPFVADMLLLFSGSAVTEMES